MNVVSCPAGAAAKTGNDFGQGRAQVQRLQRHATYGHLKQLVLRMIAEDVLVETETQATNMLTALRCGARTYRANAHTTSGSAWYSFVYDYISMW